MKTNNGILEELKELSPVLHQLKSVYKNPFVVPVNYFTSLTKEVDQHIASGLADGLGKNVFSVPENYFEDLKGNIFTAIEIGESAEIGKQSFTVPDNYFDNLADNIMDKIEAEDQPLKVVQKNENRKVIELQSKRKRDKLSPIRLWAMVAAVTALVVLGIKVPGSGFFNSTSSTMSSNEAMEYLEDNYSEFASDDLFALVDFSEEDISLDISDDLINELEEYLEENIDDLDEYMLTNEI